jgi:DNA invertase Pin-like site-specific DNA recombinase
MLIGYARVSTPDQQLRLQKDALRKAGCNRIFTDVASGAQASREGLADVLAFLRARDTLVVWKLDRLGRSLKHLIEIVTELHARQVGLQSLRNIGKTERGQVGLPCLTGRWRSLACLGGTTLPASGSAGERRKGGAP